MAKEKTTQPKESRIMRFLHVVEWLGNALPHPVSLFALFAAGVVVLSGILGYFEISVVDPRPVGARGRADNGLIEIVSLMNAEGLRLIVTNLVRNFVEFAPLGTVLVAMLGVGVAERSGWLTAVIRGMVLNARPALVTVIIVLAGVPELVDGPDLGSGVLSMWEFESPRPHHTTHKCLYLQQYLWISITDIQTQNSKQSSSRYPSIDILILLVK